MSNSSCTFPSLSLQCLMKYMKVPRYSRKIYTQENMYYSRLALINVAIAKYQNKKSCVNHNVSFLHLYCIYYSTFHFKTSLFFKHCFTDVYNSNSSTMGEALIIGGFGWRRTRHLRCTTVRVSFSSWCRLGLAVSPSLIQYLVQIRSGFLFKLFPKVSSD